jgi:dGTP triphosphohydrolase
MQEEVERQLEGDVESAEATRLIADVIASMTEEEAVSMHRKLTGAELGSFGDTPLI